MLAVLSVVLVNPTAGIADQSNVGPVVMFYRAGDGTAVTGTVGPDGLLVNQRTIGGFSTGWTQIVPTGGQQMLFYRFDDGGAVTGTSGPDGLLGNQRVISGVASDWTHVIPAGEHQLLFYRAGDGKAATGTVGADGLLINQRASGRLDDGWTHIVQVGDGQLLFYRASDGKAVTGTLNAGGQLINQRGVGGFSPGWTHITPVGGGRLLFYKQGTGLAVTGRVDLDGAYTGLQTVGGFSPDWTHITYVGGGRLLFYRAGDGNAVTGTVNPGGQLVNQRNVGGFSPGWTQIATNEPVSAPPNQVVASSRIAYAWGKNALGVLGNVTPSGTTVIPVGVYATNVVQLATDGATSAEVLSDGSLWTWGRGQEGMWGDGSPVDRGLSTPPFRLTPARVPGLPPILRVSLRERHALALGTDGSVWAWGDNSNGQLGDGLSVAEEPLATAPKRVMLPGLAVDVSAGVDNNVVLLADGSVWTWGDAGLLGEGPGERHRSVPGRANTPSGITQVSAGGSQIAALRSDGTVWSWGYNIVGEVGQPELKQVYTPTQVPGISGVTAVSAGATHTEVLKSDGTVWGWGDNAFGQLGNNATATAVPTPTQAQLPPGTFATSLETGDGLAAAVLNTGRVVAWGFLPTGDVHVPVSISPAGHASALTSAGQVILMILDAQPIPVPNLVGISRLSAQDRIARFYLRLGSATMVETPCSSAGNVIAQSMPTNTLIYPNDPVSFTYVDPSVQCTVPDIVGLDPTTATSVLSNAGLQLGSETDVVDKLCDDRLGKIIHQDKQAGTLVPPNTFVSYTLAVPPTGPDRCL